MDLIKELQMEAKAVYLTEAKGYAENAPKHRTTFVFAEKLRAYFDGCKVSPSYNNYKWSPNSVSLFLTKDFNITKDVMLFIEQEEAFLNFLCPDGFKTKDDPDNRTLDFTWDKQQLFVYHAGGNCSRVKIGQKTKVVTEDIYEIVCN